MSSGLSSFAIFLSIPLVLLHLFQFFGLAPSAIGFISGIWPTTVFLFSPLCGLLSDKWGYVWSIRTSTVLNTLGFVVVAVAHSPVFFTVGLFLFGLGKAFFDGSARAALTVVVPPAQREYYFRVRYTLINVGMVLEPLTGFWLFTHIEQYTFLLTALAYAALGVAVARYLPLKLFPVSEQAHVSVSSKLRVLNDWRLLSWIMGFSLILMAYGAYEAFMPIAIDTSPGTRPGFGVLLSLNAVTVIVFQVVILRMLPHVKLSGSILWGGSLMSFGFVFFTLPEYTYAASLLAVVVFSVGETLLFPAFEVVIDRLAPAHAKALYFGAGEIKQVGFFLGPAVAGLFYASGGLSGILLMSAVWILLGGTLLYAVHRKL